MPRTPSCADTFGASSAFSFSRRTCGSSTAAARSKAGAIVRHGPHHGAHTSSKTGILLERTWRSNSASSTEDGCASNRARRQLPHLAASAGRAGGTRFTEPQCGQTMRAPSLTRGLLFGRLFQLLDIQPPQHEAFIERFAL